MFSSSHINMYDSWLHTQFMNIVHMYINHDWTPQDSSSHPHRITYWNSNPVRLRWRPYFGKKGPKWSETSGIFKQVWHHFTFTIFIRREHSDEHSSSFKMYTQTVYANDNIPLGMNAPTKSIILKYGKAEKWKNILYKNKMFQDYKWNQHHLNYN